jgi:hypothetical protein
MDRRDASRWLVAPRPHELRAAGLPTSGRYPRAHSLGIYASVMSVERLRAELAEAERELREHMASWEYAFAMAGGSNGGREHPTHWATRARTEELVSRRRALAARLAEYEPSGGS